MFNKVLRNELLRNNKYYHINPVYPNSILHNSSKFTALISDTILITAYGYSETLARHALTS